MQDRSSKLTVLYYNDAYDTYTDISNQAFDFSRDPVSLTIATQDMILIGFERCLNTFYIDISAEADTNATTSILYTSDTNVITPVVNMIDETNGLSRSGFIQFDRPTDIGLTTVNSQLKYWYSIGFDVDVEITINGIGIVFADDNDLKKYVPEILDDSFLTGNQTTHILTHIAVRNQIISELRQKYYKVSNTSRENLTFWDLLDIEQFNTAATYLALSMIYSNVSDTIDDKWDQQSKKWYGRYQDAIKISWATIDTNNNGQPDSSEINKEFRTRSWRR
jgi:hypothetical protein